MRCRPARSRIEIHVDGSVGAADVQLTVFDSNLVVIASDNPPDSNNAYLEVTVPTAVH